MKLRAKLFWGAGVFLLLPALVLVEEHFRGKWVLDHWKSTMEARGEKFEIEHLIPSPPDSADNGLPQLVFLGGQLSASPEVIKIAPPTMHFAAPGKVIYVIGESEWPYSSFGKNSRSNLNWRALSGELTKISEPLKEIRAALKKPAFDAQLNYRAGFGLPLTHLARLKSTASRLSATILNELHDGNLTSALEDLEALLSLAGCQRDERLVISQFVRIAMAQMAVGVTWQALHAPGWSDARLLRLQAAWQSMEFIPAMGQSLEMERAMFVLSYANARSSTKQADALFSAYWIPGSNSAGASISSVDEFIEYIGSHLGDLLRSAVYIPLWRFVWSYQDELNYLKTLQEIIEAERQAVAQKSGVASDALSQRLESRARDLDLYNRIRFPMSAQAAAGVSRAVGRAVDCETSRQLVLTAIALKRYELAHQTAPSTLQALVPEFLAQIPVDYMDGQPLRYRLNEDASFRLWSVGHDQRDDGGNATPTGEGSGPGSLLKARDIVWPDPASPEETATANRTKKN